MHLLALPGSHVDIVGVRLRTGTGRPGVTNLAAEPAAAPLQSSRLASTGCPSRAEVYGERVKRNLRVLAASRVSTVTATASATSNITKALAGQGDSAIGRTQIRASKPVRPVRIICAALPASGWGYLPLVGAYPTPSLRPRKRVVPHCIVAGADHTDH